MRGVSLKISVFIVPLVILFFIKFDYSAIHNLNDILIGSIGLGSATLGFFIAGVSILQTSNGSRFYEKLVELGTNKKIIGWLMTSIGYLFLLTYLSVFMLFLDSNPQHFFFIFDIWFSTLIASFLSGLFVTLIIIIVFTK